MARLSEPPDQPIVLGLKGIVDYACWKGIYYARSWPKPPSLPRAPKVQAQYAAYAYISQQSKAIDQSTKDAYAALADGTQRTWRDYQIVLFYNKDINFKTADTVSFQEPSFQQDSFQ